MSKFINKKEILIILIVTLIIAFSISLIDNLENSLSILLAVFIVIVLNVGAKKAISSYLDSEIEIKLWEFKRYGFKAHDHFKKQIPIGAFLPIISKAIFFPLKNFVWMASLVFDIKPKTHRAAKRHGLYAFSEITEDHIGAIAAFGILINLIASAVGYFLGFSNFAEISIYYAFFNMLPISSLDGNKIFFGNIVLWSFLAAITLIGMLFALFIV